MNISTWILSTVYTRVLRVSSFYTYILWFILRNAMNSQKYNLKVTGTYPFHAKFQVLRHFDGLQSHTCFAFLIEQLRVCVGWGWQGWWSCLQKACEAQAHSVTWGQLRDDSLRIGLVVLSSGQSHLWSFRTLKWSKPICFKVSQCYLQSSHYWNFSSEFSEISWLYNQYVICFHF
jgi:hypothetical protein